MTEILRIETIGRCVAYAGERRIDPGAEVVLAGALLLGLEPGRKRVRAEMAELLWPGAASNVQLSRLRWLLSKLRNAGVPLETDGTHVWIAVEHVQCDFDIVDERLLDKVDAILAGYSPELPPTFLLWLDEQRARIGSKVLRHLLPRLGAAARAGEWQLVSSLAESVRRVDPLNEEGTLRLSEAYCRLGERTKGLGILSQYTALIGDDRPEAQLQARLLEQRIRSAESSGVRAEPRFVGRVEQLRSIDGLLRAARDGSGGALMLTGPAGIGKTRLLDEASLRASMAGMQVVQVRCQRGDTIRPLSGMVDLIAEMLDLPGSLGCEPDNLDRLRRLTHTDSERRELAASTESPVIVRQLICTAVVDLLESVADEAPLVVQIDDAQWLQQELEWLWNSAVSASSSHRIAWLFAFRTSHRAQPFLDVPQLAIPALDHSSSESLLADLIAHHDAQAIDRSALLARGAGSPLFLRELVRHCIATGTTSQLPATLVSLLDSGILTLSKYALRVLQVAAILGTYSNLERIEAIARIPRTDLLDAVIELEAAAILSADAMGATTGHVLWAEAAISQLTANVALLLHRHAAEQFELEMRDVPSSGLLWECARHWEKAGDVERARRAILAGAESLERNGFPSDAATAYARAMQWTVNPGERLRLLDRRILRLQDAGRWNEMAALIDEFHAMAAELDPTHTGHDDHEILRWRVHYYLTGDQFAQAENCFRCATSATASTGHRLRAARDCALASESVSTATLRAVHALLPGLPARSTEEQWDRALVEYMYEMRCGDIAEACRLGRQLVEIARIHPDRRKSPSATGHLVRALTLAGDFDAVRELTRRRIAEAKSLGQWSELCAAYDHVIGVLLDIDPIASVEKLIRELDNLLEGAPPGSEFGMKDFVVRAHTAQILVMKGDFERARALAFPLNDIANHAPRIRARLFAVHLAIGRSALPASELQRLAGMIAENMREPDWWLDWPASVLAEYLRDARSESEAAAFAREYVTSVRRELYPPPAQLTALANMATAEMVEASD